ncbi:hypothetical protein F2P79_017971, partial [Pimephales promelas]
MSRTSCGLCRAPHRTEDHHVIGALCLGPDHAVLVLRREAASTAKYFRCRPCGVLKRLDSRCSSPKLSLRPLLDRAKRSTAHRDSLSLMRGGRRYR